MTRLFRFGLLAAGFLALVAPPGAAQIPNPGFESWTTTVPAVPTGWVTSVINVTPSTSARSGSTAAQGATVDFGGIVAPAAMWSYFPLNESPAQFTGYYQFSPVGDDRFQVTVLLYKDNMPVAGGDSSFVGAVGSYTQFAVRLEYISSEVPDTGYVIISTIGPPDGEEHLGTTFLVDDVAFTGTVNSVTQLSTTPGSFTLEQNFPNPFNPSTTIRFSIPQESFVVLEVFTLLGQRVAQLLQEQKPAGDYSVTFDASGLPSGMYVSRLRAGEAIATRTMTLVR
jgi:hypothetical protein